MNVLTKVHRDGYHLDMWYTGGQHRVVPPPIPPHFWSPFSRFNATEERRPLMSDIRRLVPLWRVDCRTVYDVRNWRDDESFEADIPFIHLLTLLFGFKQRDTVASVGAWDLEAISQTGQFPSAHRDPISNLAYVSAQREEAIHGPEDAILEGFVNIVRQDDPDVLATYNGARFDWQYAVTRADLCGVKLTLGRENDEPYIAAHPVEFGRLKGMNYNIYLGGRTTLDVWNEVRMDTALSGEVPNRGLKTIAKYFKKKGVIPADVPIIEVPYHKMRTMPAAELDEYCLSDARLTYLLAEYYLRVIKDLAVEFQMPLNLVVDRSPSHIGQTLFGQEFKRLGVVSDATNYDRFKGVLWE